MAYDNLERFCRSLPVQRYREEADFLQALSNISNAPQLPVYKPFDLLVDDEGRVGGKYIITPHALALLCELLAPGLGTLVRHLIRESKSPTAVEVLNSVISAELTTLRDYYRLLSVPLGDDQVLFDVREADLPAVEVFDLFKKCQAGLPGLQFSCGVVYYPTVYAIFADPLTRMDVGDVQIYDGVLLRMSRGHGPLYRAYAAICPVTHWAGADGRSYRGASAAASWFPVADPGKPVLNTAKAPCHTADHVVRALRNSINLTPPQVAVLWNPPRKNYMRHKIIRMQALAKSLAEAQNTKATGLHFFLAYVRELEFSDTERTYKALSEFAPSLWSFFLKTEVTDG